MNIYRANKKTNTYKLIYGISDIKEYDSKPDLKCYLCMHCTSSNTDMFQISNEIKSIISCADCANILSDIIDMKFGYGTAEKLK